MRRILLNARAENQPGRRAASSGGGTGCLVGLMLLGLLACGAASSREPEASAPDSPLTKRLDRLISRKPLAGASVGMLVVRASDGKTLYERGADRPLIPASNQKILTALGALARFGPTHHFSTRIWTPSEPDEDGMVDELVIEGGGDPAMNSEDWWIVASELRRAGLRGVRGDVRVDDTRFEAPGWHPSWGRISSRAYHAPVGALTANYGTYFVTVQARKAAGEPAKVEVDPPVPYLHVRNRAQTASRKARPRLSVGRAPGGPSEEPLHETIDVDGVARIGDGVDLFPRSVHDPGLYAASILVHQLEAHDILVEGDVRRAPRSETDRFLLLDHADGRSVAQAVALCMKYSNNSIAESLVKNLGAWDGAPLDGEPTRQGDWVSGVRALRSELSGLGLDLAGTTLVDGSGLSIKNRLSPRTLVRALEIGRSRFAFGPEFMAALPIAERDGTLEKRLDGAGGRIRAKTGLLGDASVTSLSGYAEHEDGETFIFSILVNGYSGGSGRAMDAVDALARALLDTPVESPNAAGR